jgi:membrane protease YdiL (CAAX protease family)
VQAEAIGLVFPASLAIAHLYSGWRLRRKSGQKTQNGRVPLRRLGRSAGSTLLFTQLVLVWWLVYAHDQGHWTSESIGISSRPGVEWSFIPGFFIYCVFLAVFNRIARAAGVADRVDDAGVVGLARVIPRRKGQRVASLLGTVILNPFTEEVLFRGLLVHQLARVIESVPIALLVGLAANLACHVYQGRWALLCHGGFFGVVCGVLYSPLGLWGAIGCHFAGDLIPFVSARRELKAYRERHRRRPSVRANDSVRS